MSEIRKPVQAIIFVTPLKTEPDTKTQEKRLQAYAAEHGFNVAAVMEMGVPTSVDVLFLPIMNMHPAGVDVILHTDHGRIVSRPTRSAANARM